MLLALHLMEVELHGAVPSELVQLQDLKQPDAVAVLKQSNELKTGEVSVVAFFPHSGVPSSYSCHV